MINVKKLHSLKRLERTTVDGYITALNCKYKQEAQLLLGWPTVLHQS